jgi:phosphate/sulfate permease
MPALLAMGWVFVLAVGVIITLAVLDLWVGVTNDAVNFLNSAIGSRVAGRRRILLIASGGVLFGALFSSGMMEVARKGVFNPDFFVGAGGRLDIGAILAVYLGVMAADVILLDLFNTLGLPTSTTVSIISELVGASIAVSFWMHGGDVGAALGIINTGPVLGIYSGIFLSVIVAFSSAAIVMYLLRLLFTHDLERTFPKVGWLWTAVSFCAITYFVLLKGLRNASFLDESTKTALFDNIWWIMAGVATVSAVAALLLARHHRHVFTAIILSGTCALAIAFAGNDLVNFIGPSVAAAQAVFVEGVHLSGKVPTPNWALMAAGIMMVLALWSSRKARTVTDTEVRLAAQGNLEQRFGSTRFARALVKTSVAVGRVIRTLIPRSLRATLEGRTRRDPGTEEGAPPYDLLRASVNLTVASMLISLGTANKLPLSTTYITFMAAMGASLADGTWTRDSAESRVSGILTVLGGWVLTGLIAAASASVIASVVYVLGSSLSVGPILSLALVVGAVGLAVVKLATSHQQLFGDRETVMDEI